MVKQISVFLENTPGSLKKAAKTMGDAGINMRALSLADTSDFGIVRLIVNQPEAALLALHNANFTAKISEVLAVEVADEPHGMENILNVIEEGKLNIEYLYAFLGQKNERAIIIFQMEDPQAAAAYLTAHGVNLVPGEELYEL